MFNSILVFLFLSPAPPLSFQLALVFNTNLVLSSHPSLRLETAGNLFKFALKNVYWKSFLMSKTLVYIHNRNTSITAKYIILYY